MQAGTQDRRRTLSRDWLEVRSYRPDGSHAVLARCSDYGTASRFARAHQGIVYVPAPEQEPNRRTLLGRLFGR